MDNELLNLTNLGVISVFDFVIGLSELIFICYVFTLVYNRYSVSVSNRKVFSFQFIPFAISIFLIVFTIKSSLVLSLGLVGALSIIRFRTAIKETEQIISLLYLTGISISIAANQLILPIITSFIIFTFFIIRNSFYKKENTNDNILVSSILNFDETVYQEILQELESENRINLSLISVNEIKNITTVVIKFSEIDLNIIKSYKSHCKKRNVDLSEIKVY